MKINKSQIDQLAQQNAAAAENSTPVDKAQRAADEARAERLAGKDRASVSERARELAKARSLLEETPAVRSEKVDALHEEVAAGNYQPPLDAIARQLAARLRQG